MGLPLSLGVGLLFYIATWKSIESDSRERFANHARNAQNTISARIKSYTDVLRGAASLFRTSEQLTREQFHEYVSGLSVQRHFPAIDTINFAAYVRDQDRPEFERRMRLAASAPNSAGEAFRITPPGVRADYAVLTFIEPRPVTSATFGYDMLALPHANRVLMLSRDTGALMNSGHPIAAISGPNRVGLGIRLPIYRHNMPVGTVSERRAAYIGSVGIAFSVPKLVQGVLDEMPIEHVRLTLVDSGTPGEKPNAQGMPPGRVLFDSAAAPDQVPNPPFHARPDRFSTSLPVDFNGRVWKATFSTRKVDMYTGFDEYFPWMAMLAGFVSTMLIYALFHTLTSSRLRAIKMAKGMTRELRDSQSKLQMSHQNLRRLAAHAENIKEGERKRIAREIHDDLGQNLLALRIEADMLSTRTRTRHPRLHARAHWTLHQIDATIKSVRQIINDLRPNVLDLGLSAAVDWQISEFRRRTGIECELVESEQDIRASDHCATALFRILQESLSNISRHARATRVRVELRVDGGWISMTVSDNGVGLVANVRNKPGSFGLVGIEERVNILGGTFVITSNPGSGTAIGVSVPVQENMTQPPAGTTPVRSDEPGTVLA
ncbi:MAG: CHASE domain-containing protein [Telluria sp.]